MAKTIEAYVNGLRETRVWRSIFRSGFGATNLHRALAVQQNIFLHLFSVKMRRAALNFSVTWYLGTLSMTTFMILVATGIPLMLYYHPSVPQAYADMKDLQFVVSAGVFLRNLHRWSAHAMLPWDQLAYWAITVGSNIMSAVPLLGQKMRFLMLGGNSVNANALLRFYVLHCVILPLAAILFIGIHFWRIRKDGGLYTGEGKPRE
jgi:quinol-cytochrome oxidoreductase complex cytochrome b subunit